VPGAGSPRPAAPAAPQGGGTVQYVPGGGAARPDPTPVPARPQNGGGTVQYVPGSGAAQPAPTPAPAKAPGSGTVQYVPNAGSPRVATPAPAGGGTVQYVKGSAPARPAAPPPPPAPEYPAPEPGEKVRQYELIRRLGKGGMGEVFLARDTRLGRRVAIKFLHTQDPALVQRFVLEARATARCNHENIVTLYEADTHQGRPYMALEFLQGRTLAALLEDGKPMPPGRAVELVAPVLRALERAHAEGIVHRDLKPENVFLTDAGVVKVLDFGIAKVTGAAEPAARRGSDPAIGDELVSLTQHGTTLGTLAYMSPEQWMGGDLDRRTDLWAAGIMLFHMLAGKHPLHGLQGMQLARVAQLDEPMPSLAKLSTGLPTRLVQIVDACLQKDRAKRPPDALTLLRALEPYLPGRAGRELEVDESPYAGLSAFQEADADRFFGRTHEIAAMVARLRDRPVIAVVGPSGIGKSSFVRAGVVPALKRSGEDWKAYVIRPGRSPLAALAATVAQVGATGSGSQGSVVQEATQERDLVARLVAEPGHAGSVLRAAARRHNRRILVLVDQFEEIFTHVPDEKERLAFTACLAGIADDATSPVRLVISIRSDFLERVAEDPRFMAEVSAGLFFLTRPSDQGLRDALTLPAEMAGFRFETPEMVDAMIHDLRSTNGALSLLQFTASQLWDARDTGQRVLTRASYDAIGGITGALAGYADRFLEQLAEGPRAAAREVFLRLVTPDRTRAIASVDELKEVSGRRGEVEPLLEQLAQARLVVISKSDRGSTAELVHESLIHGWPTLRHWLDETGEDAHFLEQLRGATHQWAARGHAADLLWRGELADEAARFQRRYRRELPEQQKAFLDAVVSQMRRAARRRRTFAVAGVMALLLVAAGSLVALVVIRRAQQEAVRQRAEAVRQQTEAERQAGLARVAEAAAKQQAAELAVKERERDEAARRAEAVSAELAAKNAELGSALSTAQDARRRATDARQRAEDAATAARLARERADQSARELAVRLAEEKARADRLQQQFGSPMAEVLPP
jgi:hypothetical protein